MAAITFQPNQILTAEQLDAAFANTVSPSNPVFNPPVPISSGGTGSSTATGATSNLQYLQGSPGSVAESVTAKLQQIVTVKDFGARGDGATNDTAAIQAAINALAASGGTVVFPDGNYRVSSTIALAAGVSLAGESEFSSTILPQTASMTVFSLIFGTSSAAELSVRDLSIQCGTVANVQGFQFTYCNRVNLENISFFGCLNNFTFDRGGLHRVVNCTSAGTATLASGAAKMWSSTDTEYGSVFSIVEGYRAENNGAGIQSPMFYFRRAVAVKVSQLVTTNNAAHGTGTGILIENDCQGICVENSLMVDFVEGCVFQQGAGIAVAPTVNILSDVDFDQCSTNSILLSQGAGNQIRGGVITSSAVATTSQAIVINSGASENTIDGTHISGYFGAGGTGVLLNGCSGNRLYGVQVGGSTQGVAFSGSVTQTHIAGCDFSSGVTTAIAGSVAGVGNNIQNVKGFSGAALIASPAVPASTVPVTNNFGIPARIFVNGGAVSLLSINGVASGFTTGSSLILYPGESVALTYSSAPSWNWIGI